MELNALTIHQFVLKYKGKDFDGKQIKSDHMIRKNIDKFDVIRLANGFPLIRDTPENIEVACNIELGKAGRKFSKEITK